MQSRDYASKLHLFLCVMIFHGIMLESSNSIGPRYHVSMISCCVVPGEKWVSCDERVRKYPKCDAVPVITTLKPKIVVK